MKQPLTYEEILTVCRDINEKYMPDDSSFYDKIDELLQDEESSADELVLQAYLQLLKTLDNEIEKIEAKADIKPTCFIGCAHCCYFPIIVTKLEAKIILQHIKHLPEDERQGILNHLKRYFEEQQPEIESACQLDFQENPDFKHQYIAKQLPCPMLDTKTNTCVAYEARPTPCRTYLNYASPKVCADNLVPKEPFSYEFLHEYYFQALNELIQALLYGGEEMKTLNYPDDLFEYDYLPNHLKRELNL
ncbi:YkgJ family cysteine cluster protein [Bacillus tianshenii]|nr:YkgJ family cysteine cluster protein [Bacillus tianshenii]